MNASDVGVAGECDNGVECAVIEPFIWQRRQGCYDARDRNAAGGGGAS